MRREFGSLLIVGDLAGPPPWLVRGAPLGTPILCCRTSSDARAALERGTSRLLLIDPFDAEGNALVARNWVKSLLWLNGSMSELGRIQISDQPPPKGTLGVKPYGAP